MLQPLLYWKNTVQQGLPISFNPMVMYRGITVSVTNMAVLTGLQFPLTGAVGSMITGGVDRPMNKTETVAASCAGGAISGFVCAPMELVMIQQQRFGSSMAGAASRIIGERGVLDLWRGLITSCGREGIFTAGYLGMGPVFSQTLKESYGMDNKTGNFFGAIGAGIISAAVSHPLDTIKTCMQGDIERQKYKGLTDTYRQLMAEGGVAAFYRGGLIRTGRMICAVWIIGQCKDFFGPLLFPGACKIKEEKKGERM